MKCCILPYSGPTGFCGGASYPTRFQLSGKSRYGPLVGCLHNNFPPAAFTSRKLRQRRLNINVLHRQHLLLLISFVTVAAVTLLCLQHESLLDAL